MSSKRLTDISSSTGLTLSDLIHIVNTGDTSQGNPAGSSYKATLNQVADAFSSIFSKGFTGGTVSGPTNFNSGLSANTLNTTSITLNGLTVTGFTNFVIGGSYSPSNSTLTLNTQGGTPVSITGLTFGGSFTGGTVVGQTTFSGGLSANTINVIGLTANTVNTTSFTLNGVTITGFTFGNTFTGNTSATCITDLYVSNLNSCSPLHIQNISDGSVLIGENGNIKVGIGTSTPSETLEVSGKIKTLSLQISSGTTFGHVLTSDDNGNATWQLPVRGEKFTGGTVSGPTNFTNGLTADTINATSITLSGVSYTSFFSDIMDYINKRYCDLEAEFTSYPDQRYTTYPLGNSNPNHHIQCCGEIPSPFSQFIPSGSTPCDPVPNFLGRWFDYAKPITPSVEVNITGGETPYTYEWKIVEGDEAGHYFRGCFDTTGTTTNKVYLDVNFVKTFNSFQSGNGKYKVGGPYVTNTITKEDGSTIAGTTLQLKVTDVNGANKTFYYRYTSEECYPINASVCNTYNVEFCDQGQTFFNWVTMDLDFMDDERRIPTCTDLNSYGIYRPELNEGDIENILRTQRDSFMQRQWAVLLASSAGTAFQPYDKPSPGFIPSNNLNLNSLTFPHNIFHNNNGKAPLKYINVFDGGYPISQIYYEDAGVLKNMWTDVIDPDYGTTLADRYPGVVDLKRRPAVKTAADLPTLTSNDPISIEPGQIIRVFDVDTDLIWNSTLSIWEPISIYFDDVLTTRRSRRSTQQQTTNEMTLAMKPFTWANIYVLQHAIKTYKEIQITNI